MQADTGPSGPVFVARHDANSHVVREKHRFFSYGDAMFLEAASGA